MIEKLQAWLREFSEKLASFFAALLSPIERLCHVLFRGLFAAADSADAAGSIFTAMGRAILWPVRMMARGVGLLFPARVRDWVAGLGEAITRGQGRLTGGLVQLAERLNLDWLVAWIVWLLQPVWRPVMAIGWFVYGWSITREFRRALWGLPAMVMAGLVFGIAGWNWVSGQSQLIPRYKQAVQEALESQDYQLANLYERKLAQLGVDTQLTDYRTALALAEQDKFDAALERMERLAPDDRPGYPAAHFWLIQQLMSGRLDDPSDVTQARVKKHLDHLETLGIAGPTIELVRAIWLAQQHRLEEAVRLLEPLAPVMVDAAFERMRINLALERTEDARQDARSLVIHMNNRERRGVQLTGVDYQMWLAGEDVLGSLEQVRRILDLWLELEPENEAAQQSLVRVYRRQADQLLRAPLPDVEQIVGLWLQAAELEQSSAALRSLARGLYHNRDQAPLNDSLLKALRDSPRTPASLLRYLGTQAAIEGQYDEAQRFLATAVGKDDSNASGWNNYGLVLAEIEPPRLDEALRAVNRALALEPEAYRFRETRGQILLKMKRWDEAIHDLEYALNGLPDLGAIHQSLAEAYAALGRTELARLHRGEVE